MNLNHTKNALAIILLLIAPAISFAQNRNTTDSLKSIIAKTNQDTTKIHTYLNLSREYQYLNLDSAFFYSDQALKKSLNINYKKGIADVYRQKGTIAILLNNYKLADSLLNVAISGYREIYYQFGIMECYIGLAGIAYNKGDNHLLLDYSEKALKIAEDKDLTDYSAMILLNIGLAYTKLGNYEKAIKNLLHALKIFEELNNKKMIAGCNINIGNFFIEIKEPDKGLEYMSKALKIYTKLEDTENQRFCYANIGAALAEMKKYNKALQNFNDALKLDLTNNDLIGVSVNYNNIGSIYRELGQYEMATEYFNKSLKIKEQIGDKRGTAICYHNITQAEIKLKNYKIAEEYCLKSIELFGQIEELDKQRKALEQLANIYNLAGKYQNAYNTYIEAAALKDSIFNIEKAEKIAQLEEKYLNEKLEKQNLTLKFENNLQQTEILYQKKLRNIYFIAFIFAVVAIIIIVIQFRKKNILNKYLVRKNIDLLNKEKELKDIKKTTATSDKKEEILNKLIKLLDNEKIFKNIDLRIVQLAKRLSTNRTYLSQIINEEFGKNYSDFINEYRVKESMLLFSDPQMSSELSIAGIANEVGFRSIPSYICAFKKFTGITPSKFRNESNILKINTKNM